VGAGNSVERGDGVARTCAGAGSLSIYNRDAYPARRALEMSGGEAASFWALGPPRNLANIAAQVITSAAAGLTAGAAINADLAAEDAKRAVGATPQTPATTASH
jgi:hypothetical protein